MKTLQKFIAAILFCTFTLGVSAQEMLELSEDLPSEISFKGKVQKVKKWRDDNGINYILLTQTDPIVKKGKSQYDDDKSSIYIYAYHYISGRDGYELSRKITDYELECQFDLLIGFHESSLTVTDIDGDNKAEITFSYYKTCTSDLSSKTMKLMMLEDGTKYALRGNTQIEGFEGGGECNIDKSFKSAPKGFLKHAKKIWDDHNTETY